MVGFDPSSKEKLGKIEHAIAGGGSGAVTRFLCQPLDVVKIRFQLQVEPISKKCSDAKYSSMLQATRQIAREEGTTALWKGHMPAQILSIVYGVTQFVSFELLTKHMWHISSQSGPHQSAVHFMCGAAAGCLATLFSFPYDVIRTRLVAQGEPKIYRGINHAFLEIYTKEGPRAFFKGLSPTLLQVAPHTGAQFAFYKLFKDIWREWGDKGEKPVSMPGSLVCGALSGLCAKALIYPFDLARKRLQVQGFESAREPFGKVFQCRGLLHCIWLTVQEEKIAGLFKGLSPSLVKAAATTALHFGVYEKICEVLASFHR